MDDPLREQKEFNSKVIAKIEQDPDFLGHLIEAPEEALLSSGLVASPTEFSDEISDPQGDDVEGHRGGPVTWYNTCGFWYRRIKWHRR